MPEQHDPGKMKPEELKRKREAGYEVKASDGKAFMPNEVKK
jgi:hypothetical protein